MSVEQSELIMTLERLVYVPGLWRCPKCKFQLVQAELNAATGNVTARDRPGDKCPNCHGPLWRVTERDAGNEMVDQCEAAIKHSTEIEALLMTALALHGGHAFTHSEREWRDAARRALNINRSRAKPEMGSTAAAESIVWGPKHIDPLDRPEEWKRAAGGPRAAGPMLHNLKCATGYFESVANGRKTAELRRMDRDFRRHDILRLHEVEFDRLTGRTVERRIAHIVWDSNGPWLAAGHCMLSLGDLEH